MFQSRGPATAKLLSPSWVLVQGMIPVSTSTSADRIAYQLAIIFARKFCRLPSIGSFEPLNPPVGMPLARGSGKNFELRVALKKTPFLMLL